MLMAYSEVQRLTREINALQSKAIETHNKLANYQQYAGMLGGTSIMSMSNIAGLSPELLPRARMFAQFSNQVSSISAMQNLQAMKMMGGVPWTGNPMAQYQIETSAFAKFKEQSLKALKEQEARVLNEKEKEIKLEINDIEQQLSTKKAMLESVKSSLSEQIKDSVPKF